MNILETHIRKAVKRFVSIAMTIALVLSLMPAVFTISAKAADASIAPEVGDITVTNNAKGTADIIYVTGVSPKDVVAVYNASSGGKKLGSKTVSSSGSDATVKITQLGVDAGTVYVSVKSSGCTESSRTEVDYTAEPESDAPVAENITVTNNAKGTADIVYVCGLSPKDIVKVYNESEDGKVLGRKTVGPSGSDTTVKISQLGASEGYVYVSVTSKGYTESARTEAGYEAEPGSESPDLTSITVTNNAKGTADTVYVSGLTAKDVVKVYSASSGGKKLGSATVSTSRTDATVKITQLGTTEGYVYVTVTSTGCTESGRTEVSYAAEGTSVALDINDITIKNNPKGTSDTVYVSGLSEKDIIKVYDAITDGKTLGSATVATSGTAATVSITQLGTASGTVYVSVKSYGYAESSRVAVNYDAELVSTAPTAIDISVINNAKGTIDTVYVQKLSSGDKVTVYNSEIGGSKLGTATATSTDVTVSIAQLGSGAGKIYVTVTSASMSESARVEIDYDAEASTDAPITNNIIITNNPTGTSDTVYVSGLAENDLVKVYNSSTGGTVLGKITATGTTATVTIKQLSAAAGKVYISITSAGKVESTRIEAEYSAEVISTAPIVSDIVVTNNASGTADTVYVAGLQENDVVKVYQTAKKGTALGTETVASGTTYATVSITQLGTAAGSVFVTVTSTNKTESVVTEATYTAEEKTTEISASSVSVTNNYNVSDVVTVTGLTYGDIIKVYNAANGGTLLGSDTVSTYSSTATVSIEQLGSSAGKTYVSLTRTGKVESSRTPIDYEAESKSTAPTESNVTIKNNAGASDTISVIGLLEGDVVTVYKAASGLTKWGTGTVASSSSTINITVSQLGTTNGSVYISVASADMSESSRTKIDYLAEEQSTAPTAANATVVNNYLLASTVTVTGLENSDIVNVYNASSGGTLLGTGTVSTYGTSVAISLSSLSASGGTVYLTATSTNKSESVRTPVTYSTQKASTAPSASDVTIVNNADISDTITVKNTSSGTVINVYNAESGGDLLGTATASSTSVVISIDQLGSSSGAVYITAKTSGKTESSRKEVTYIAESASDAILPGNVKIVNNSGTADTVTITGLSSGDVVKVYKASTGGTAISTTTATGTLSTAITISQLGTSSGSIYLTVTTSGKTESNRTKVDYQAESTAPATSQVTVVNNAGISDTITVTGLTASDILNVYSDSAGKTMIGTATVASSSTSGTITVSQLSSAAGYIYISTINSCCAESSLTKVSYLAEQTTDAPDEGSVYTENNSGTSDKVTVNNLSSGDVVKVYNSASDGKILGNATVASGNTSATVTIAELGTSSGSIYVSIKTKGKLESRTTEISYNAESQSDAPYSGYVSVVNNVSISDTVTVTNLNATDLVKVYNAAASGTLLGYATVTSGSTGATISISQLGSGAGTVYVSVTKVGKTESNRTAVDYVAETVTEGVALTDVKITNNPNGTTDTIEILNLTSGDKIQVYDNLTAGNLLGSATVSSTGNVTISISQLGASSSSVYISRTSNGKSESGRTKINYAAE